MNTIQVKCIAAVIHDQYNLNRGDVVSMPESLADTLKAFVEKVPANPAEAATNGNPLPLVSENGETPPPAPSDTLNGEEKMAPEVENKMEPDAEVENKRTPAANSRKKR